MDTVVLREMPLPDGKIDWSRLEAMPEGVRFIQLPNREKQPAFWEALIGARTEYNPAGTVEGVLRRAFSAYGWVITGWRSYDLDCTLLLKVERSKPTMPLA